VISFQSPRRWGGVGLSANRATSARLNLSFNPLRGGAGSGWSIWQALLNAFACLVSIPSEVGRGRAQPSQDHEESAVQEGSSFNPLGGGAGSGSRTWPISINTKAGLFRFNPLGGGAGSGSMGVVIPLIIFILGFQSPRRWGGVGLIAIAGLMVGYAKEFQSPRRWGGVGPQVGLYKCSCGNEKGFQSPRR